MYIYESELISSWYLLSFYLFFLYIFRFLFSSFSILCWSSKTQKQKIVYVFVVDGPLPKNTTISLDYMFRSNEIILWQWNNQITEWHSVKLLKPNEQIQSHFLSIWNGTKKKDERIRNRKISAQMNIFHINKLAAYYNLTITNMELL